MVTIKHLAVSSLLLCVGASTSSVFASASQVQHTTVMTCAIVNTMPYFEPSPLDTLLAPIALYPDPLVLQILECAQKPDQVKKLYDWIKKYPDIKGTAAQDAVTNQGFEPSFVAIVLFPQVVSMMAEKPDWTINVGQAFAKNRAAVFASIQSLRAQALAVGNLKSSEQQQVDTVKTSSGQEVIVIQPANPQVVYVPQYNPQVVYTQAPPPSSSGGDAAVAGLVGFTAGIIIGAAIADNNNVYYNCGGWGYRGAAISNEGWNDYADHRQDMANDYYDHRENMAAQRGENQSNRQDARNTSQSNRQEAASANQANRQEAAKSGQAPGAQTATATGATAKARGTAPAGAAANPQATGTKSSAFSGYQQGATERQASERGRASTSSRSSGTARSGGGGGGGGGRRR